MIFKVNGQQHAQLLEAWEKYKKDYIVFDGENYGQVIDPSNGVTTSEGQSYAMLRAAWMNDKYTFLGSWLWTRNHLQHRLNDKLLSWKWQDGKLADSASATDADEDIALALLFGYKLWDEEEYLTSAQEIIEDIWEHCVVKINGRYHLLPMHEESADKWKGYLFNPSYLSPASYRIFAEADPKHDWDALAEDSYEILNYIGEMKENGTYLPSDWLYLDKKYGAFYTANPYFERDVDHFSFDAFRTLWRVSLDEQWFGTEEAKTYLQKTGKFLMQYRADHDRMPMILATSGEVIDERNALAMDTGYAMAFKYNDDKVANDFFDKYVDIKYNKNTHQWGERASYYDANWAWFGTGTFHKLLPNIWELNVLKDNDE
jgi:endo-1,4-beta-D-glucanase Y